MHGLPVGRPQKQPAGRGPVADAVAGDEPDGRPPGGRCHYGQPDVHALRPGAHCNIVRKSWVSFSFLTIDGVGVA